MIFDVLRKCGKNGKLVSIPGENGDVPKFLL